MRVIDWIENKRGIDNTIAYLTITGSRGYGIDVEGSDTDYRGFYLPKKEEILLMGGRDTSIHGSDKDIVLYSFSQLIWLLKKNNPNILELFGTRKEDILHTTKEGKLIRDNLHLFLSKEVVAPIIGCVQSHIKCYEKTQSCKEMANALRLLKMGEEMLLEGLVNTYRNEKDREILLAIKTGLVSKEDMILVVNEGLANLRKAEVESKLQDYPQLLEINKKVMAINENIIVRGIMEG